MTESAIVPAESKLDLALLKAVGLDRAAPEQRQLAVNIAERYGLDLLLKHLVLVEGRPYITRDGLLHVAHRSGVLDGIEVTDPALADGFWRATCSVYRKDMSRPFTYGGRYPEKGSNAKFGPEMAVKVAEVMALRRAFDVSAPVVEERWDIEAPAEPPPPKPTLAERIEAKAAAIVSEPEPAPVAVPEPPAATGGLTREALKDLCVRAGKSTAAISKVLGCRVDEVAERVTAMTDAERGVLADELNLDWRAS